MHNNYQCPLQTKGYCIIIVSYALSHASWMWHPMQHDLKALHLAKLICSPSMRFHAYYISWLMYCMHNAHHGYSCQDGWDTPGESSMSACRIEVLKSSISLVSRVLWSLAVWISCWVCAQPLGSEPSLSFSSCFMACKDHKKWFFSH